MTTRVEIQPFEIREGDLIRAERTEGVREGRVLRYEDNEIRFIYGRDWYVPGSTIYLLDRPTPPAVLPSVPTLGWLSVFYGSVGGTRAAFEPLAAALDAAGLLATEANE